ncbi:phosphatase [Garciella nitratireducens]|uniref:phosphatase n=1 Tax=Garciella nitratireducens TaxID=218205 RepID=UPI000DE89D87|nr:phosphatase [Garciella nitratireducens]RBP44767.1 putative hydrolase [Garciella nitratireducens]
MKFILDTHCHTIASGHAYSTINEIVEVAKEKGLELISITDHGPELSGFPNVYYFSNLKVVPSEIKGVKVLKGVEANIMDCEGNLDLPQEFMKNLDIVLAGLHDPCFIPRTKEQNTQAVLNAMNNPYVDILVHPGNPLYKLDYDRIVEEAHRTNTLIEINNSSFISREGSYENCLEIAKKCKERGVKIILGSDTHYAGDVGNFSKARKILGEVEFPEELIMNTSVEKLVSFLREKGKHPLRGRKRTGIGSDL